MGKGNGGGNGFRGLVIQAPQDDSRDIEGLRKDIDKDFKKRLKKQEKKDSSKNDTADKTLRMISVWQNWEQLQTIRQNIATRLAGLGQLAETSGPNQGKIVVSGTWDAKAQALVAKLADTVIGIDVDLNNGLSSLQSMDLWTILTGEIGTDSHQLNESLFSGLMMMRFTGGGLQIGSMYAGLPGMPSMINQLLLPRLLTAQITVIA